MPSRKPPREERQVSVPASMDSEDAWWCCICFDAYGTSTRDKGTEVPVQLPCGHVFGGTCITRWMQTKTTCPLCRVELFDVEFDDVDEYDVWTGEHQHDSVIQPSEVFSAHASTHSVACGLPGKQFATSESKLGYSVARSSTAAHRSFNTRPNSSLSATPRHATQPYRSHAEMGRRYGHEKISTIHFERENVWNTASRHKRADVAAAGLDKSWITVPYDHGDEINELELHRRLNLHEARILSLSDSLFDDLVAEHMQWMAELNQALYDSHDLFDLLV